MSTGFPTLQLDFDDDIFLTRPLLSPLSTISEWTDTTSTTYGQSTPPNMKRHDEYYLEDGNVIFLVEDILFRVHKHFFVRESPVFRDMLMLPTEGSGVENPEGLSDERPIHLPQVSPEAFADFLWVFYNPNYSKPCADAVKWKNILALSHLWGFKETRKLAFQAIELAETNVPAATRIALGERYEARGSFVARAMTELATRSRSLTEDEGEELGGRMAVKIMQMRENCRLQRREGDDWGRSWRRQYERQSGRWTPPGAPIIPYAEPPGPVIIHAPHYEPVHIPDPQPFIIQPPPPLAVTASTSSLAPSQLAPPIVIPATASHSKGERLKLFLRKLVHGSR